MIKAFAAAALTSFMVCSAAGAGTLSSASGLKSPAASEVVQVGSRGGRSGARAGGGRRSYAHRGGGHRRGRGYGGGWGGDDGGWGYGPCTWVGPVRVCP